MDRTGKIVCTGNLTHSRRTLMKYAVSEGMFVVSSTQAVGGTTHYVVPEQPDGPTQSAGVERVRLRCPSCQRDMRIKAETLHTFLTIDLPGGSTYRDVSVLSAIL